MSRVNNGVSTNVNARQTVRPRRIDVERYVRVQCLTEALLRDRASHPLTRPLLQEKGRVVSLEETVFHSLPLRERVGVKGKNASRRALIPTTTWIKAALTSPLTIENTHVAVYHFIETRIGRFHSRE